MPEESTAPARPGRLRGLLPIVGLAFALAILVFWYTPAVLYSANEQQFYFPLLQVLPVLAIPLLIAVAVAVLPAVLMSPKVRQYYAALIAAVAVFFWVQGFLLVRDYGLLDGQIDLPAFSPAPLFVIAALIIGATAAAAQIRPTLLIGAFVSVIVVLLAHIVVITVADPNPVRALEPAKVGSLYDLGSENLLVVLLDSLQSDVFAEILEERPEIAKDLEGFTYYPNTLGVGATTYGSLPTIHAGRVRREGESMEDLFNNSIKRDSFEVDLTKSGWNVTHVNPIGGTCTEGIDSCFLYDPTQRSGSTTRLFQESAELLDLVMFRLVPPGLKNFVYNGNRFRVRGVFKSVSIQESSDTAIVDFTDHVRRDRSATKTMKFLHFQSTHPPATRAADCSLLTEPPAKEITRAAAKGIGTCAMTRVAALATKLQKDGLYDNTSIILLADHGYMKMANRNSTDDKWTELMGISNPLLAVKPAGAKAAFETSDAQMSLVDVKTIVCALTKGCDAVTQNWDSPPVDRPRFFMNYEWHDEFWHAATLKNEHRYEVRGPQFDPASWSDLGGGAAPEVSHLSFGSTDHAGNFGFGWGMVEGEGGKESRWALGRTASLNLRLPDDRDSHLELDVSSLPEHRRQSFTLKVNRKLVGEAKVNGDTTVSFDVPRSVSGEDIDEIIFTFAQFRGGDPNVNRHQRRAQRLAVRFDELRIS
jgi:hypothetical protein